LLIVTEPFPTCLRPVVHFDDVYVRPDGAGRLRIGSVPVDEALPPDVDLASAVHRAPDILRRAIAAVPMLEGARVEGIRLGWRPMPADGHSAVGPIVGLTGYYLVFTHSGVTLGPLLGRFVAEEVTRGQPRAELAPFRPERLVTRG
jgi:glycine/D-amino acid oxidase-like deaminating enzyme